ncbi:MAG TPA: hypothetical protein VI037_04945 [Nitrososphaera sp.]
MKVRDWRFDWAGGPPYSPAFRIVKAVVLTPYPLLDKEAIGK